MIIKSIFLGAFGKFKDKEIKFEDGINVIYGTNESGKTTVHHFIKGMLFGFFKYGKKKKTYSIYYQKYKPWQDTRYFGMLEYEYEGKTLQVERHFLKGQEKLHVYDKTTGKRVEETFRYSQVEKMYEALPEELGINEGVFNEVLQIRQYDSAIKEEYAQLIMEQLFNVQTAFSQNISILDTMAHIKKREEGIGTKNRRNSKYGQTISKLDHLKEEIGSIKSKLKECEGMEEKLEMIQGKLEEENKKKALLDDIKASLLNDEYPENKKSKLMQYPHLMKKYQNCIDLSQEQVNDTIFKTQTSETNDKQRRVYEIKNTIKNQIAQLESIKAKKQKYIILFAIACGLGIIGLLLGVFISVALYGVGVLGLITALVLPFKVYNAEKKMDHSKIELEKLRNSLYVYEQMVQESQFDVERKDCSMKLLNEKTSLMNSIYEEITHIENTIYELRLEYNQIKGIVAYDLNEKYLIGLNEKKSIEKILDDFQLELDACEMAKEVIQNLSTSLQSQNLERFNDIVGNIFSIITDGRYKEVKVNEKLISVAFDTLNNRFVPIEQLSYGTIQQLYFAIRVGLIECIFEDNKVPIIIDEGFAYCDTNRMKAILKYLNQINKQVILLTCRKTEIELLNKCRIKYNLIDI